MCKIVQKFYQKPLIIAGPCSAENEHQFRCIADALASNKQVHALRVGVWKPRTRPGHFEGKGHEALEWIKAWKHENDFPVLVEVGSPAHVEAAITAGVDIVWIGARSTGNPFCLEALSDALSGTGLPVFVKNPTCPDIELWTGAVERLQRKNIPHIGLIHRGFCVYPKLAIRNRPYWSIVTEIRKRFPDLPFLCDPSHMAGHRKYVEYFIKKARDFDFDGLIVESHCNPPAALTDAQQQLLPSELFHALRHWHPCADKPNSADVLLRCLRDNIDLLDNEILNFLEKRKALVQQIAEIKYQQHLPVLQSDRWENIKQEKQKLAQERGIDKGMVENIFEQIHQQSVREQERYFTEQDERHKEKNRL